MKKVLEARMVRKIFVEGAQRVEVLRGVSLDVSAGEIVSLEGPSGSGKTTLLSIMGCILTPSAGEIQIGGRQISGDEKALREARRTSIGFVFQQFNLFPALTARENIIYALSIKGRKGVAALLEADRVIDAVGLADRRDFLPRDLSGGQKQRVAIARALAGSPEVILADEPTANLDSTVGVQILDLFRNLAKSENKGLIIVTHDPKVRRVADRVVGIADGLLLQEAHAA
ncbi:MAG: ABC transporter ATP-binding protein [Vicinamibacteria bacterium]|nr:ABC transporter ATP-binding protein [Vicinamibacteria bacterium]